MGMTITITAFITVTLNTAIHNNYQSVEDDFTFAWYFFVYKTSATVY